MRLLAKTHLNKGGVFIVGSGKPTNVIKIVKVMAKERIGNKHPTNDVKKCEVCFLNRAAIRDCIPLMNAPARGKPIMSHERACGEIYW